MGVLSVEKVNVKVGNFKLKDVSLKVGKNEILVILGDNGAGKTKMLEAIAGFIPLQSGRITLNGRELGSVPIQKRKIGFIFQNLALFPHMSVEKNIFYGIKYSEKRKIAFDVIELFGLHPFLKRMPSTLSGGEKQKVALARALAVDPEIVLFDEPTSALSARERNRLDDEIRKVLKEMGKSAIFVTHNEMEAFVIGDRVSVMANGRIVQSGGIEEVFYRPRSLEVAELFGSSNILEGMVVENHDGLLKIRTHGETIVCVGNFNVGDRVYVLLRPENVVISLGKSNNSVQNAFKAKISKIVKKGPILEIETDSFSKVLSFVTTSSFEKMRLKVGMNVRIEFKASALHVFKNS